MEYLKSDFKDLVNDRIIDGDFIRNVAHVWTDKYGFADYVDSIRFCRINTNAIGFYDDYNRSVLFDIDNVTNKVKRSILPFKKRVFNILEEEEILEIYHRIFIDIMHECGHGYQQQLIDDGSTYESKLFELSLKMALKYESLYVCEHDNFPHEHYSDLVGVLFAQDIMNYLLDDNYFNESEQLIRLKKYLLRNYFKIGKEYMSPCEKVIALSKDTDLKENYNDICSLDIPINPITRTSLGIDTSSSDLNLIKSLDKQKLDLVKKRILIK